MTTATVHLNVCVTCGYNPDEPEAPRPGKAFAEAIATALAQAPDPALSLHPTKCLMACERHCNVALQSAGKMSYVLGDFSPDASAAEALIEYARLYAESETGVVPFKQWPDGVRGHFVARVPPLP